MRYNRRAVPSRRRNRHRRSSLLKAVMLLLALTVSTACTSIPNEPADDPYREILVSMAPEAPTIPVFPTLSWTYENGLYCMAEADADALLDYGENELPLFAHRYGQYQRQMRLILDALAMP